MERSKRSAAEDTTKEGCRRRIRGQEEGNEERCPVRGKAKGKVKTESCHPLQHQGLPGSPVQPFGLALKVSGRVTRSLPTPYASFPAKTRHPFSSASYGTLYASALAVPTTWGVLPSVS